MIQMGSRVVDTRRLPRVRHRQNRHRRRHRRLPKRSSSIVTGIRVRNSLYRKHWPRNPSSATPPFRFFTKHESRLLPFPCRQPFHLERTSLPFSPRGEAKWVRGPSGRGARRLARAGVLEQYVEHGKQAQRSHGGRMACFGPRVVRNAGSRPPPKVFTNHETRNTNHGFFTSRPRVFLATRRAG